MLGDLSSRARRTGPETSIRTGKFRPPVVADGMAPAVGVMAGPEVHAERSALTPARSGVTLGAASGEGGDRWWGESEVSVSLHDAWSKLICAGWLPQDHVFGWSSALI